MNTEEIKKQMMVLWEHIFHDSKEYIDLIFSNYFDEKFIEYHEENGKIISSLLAIPYKFNEGENSLKGLYLCGLLTVPEYRHRGLMSELLSRIENRLKNEFDFIFLIPSSGHNAYFYLMKGYHNGIYKLDQYFTDIHDFHNDFLQAIKDPDEKTDKLKETLYDALIVEKYDGSKTNEIITFIREQEEKKHQYLSLIHSEKDLEIAIRENKISGGDIFYSLNPEDKISSVAFVVKEGINRIKIIANYIADYTSFFKLLDHIKKCYASYSLTIVHNPDNIDRVVLWDRISSLPNPEGDNLEALYGIEERPYNINALSKPYGMVKILNFENIFRFIAKQRKDLKFQFSVRKKKNKIITFNISRGELDVKEFIESEEPKKHIPTILSEKDLANILLRKKDNSNLIMEAFGIPRLAINISLMLD